MLYFLSITFCLMFITGLILGMENGLLTLLVVLGATAAI